MASSGKKYCIVNFLEDSFVEVIPSSWLVGENMARWPTGKSVNYTRHLIRKCALPEDDWTLAEIKVYCYKNTFAKANEVAARAQETSDVGSDSSDCELVIPKSRKRKIKTPSRFLDCNFEMDLEKDIKPDISQIDIDEISMIPHQSAKRSHSTTFELGSLENTSSPSSSGIFSQTSSSTTQEKSIQEKESSTQTMMHRIFQSIEDIKNKVSRLSDRQEELNKEIIDIKQALTKETRVSNSVLPQLPENISLPVSTEDDLRTLNRNLVNNTSLQSDLMDLRKIINDNLPISIKHMIEDVMTRLADKGVETAEDLKYVNFEIDFKDILKDIPARKFKEKIDNFLNSPSNQSGNSASARPVVPSPVVPNPEQINVGKNILLNSEGARNFESHNVPKLIIDKLEKSKKLQSKVPNQSEGPTSAMPVVPNPEQSIAGDSIQLSSNYILNTEWAHNFKLQNVPKMFIHKLETGKRFQPTEYRDFLRLLARQILNVCASPGIKNVEIIARNLVNKYPTSLKEVLDDKVVGTGQGGLLQKLIARIENMSRNDKRQSSSNFFYSVKYLTEMNDQNSDLIKNHLKEVNKLSNWNMSVIEKGMKDTFSYQRREIIAMKSVKNLKEEWPFLFWSRIMIIHFNILTKMDVVYELACVMEKKVPQLYAFLKSCNMDLDETKTSNFLEVLCRYFNEDLNQIKVTIKDKESITEIHQRDDIPMLPFIVVIGNALSEEKNCIVMIEKLPSSEVLDLATASLIWFISFYVFNLKYPKGCSATAEFIQRAFFGINKGTNSWKRCRYSAVDSKVQKLVEKLCTFKSSKN